MEKERIEMAESAKQSDAPEKQYVSAAANRNIMVVAPHGVMGDDDFTGIIAKGLAMTVDCSAVINVDYQKPESMDQIEPDYENNLANLNDWEHINGDETVKQEFLEPIKEFIADVKNTGGKAIIPLIHGISDEHISLVAEKPGPYQENPEALQIILGYGQGGETPTSDMEETIIPLIRSLKSEGINASIAPNQAITGTDGRKKKYCAADPNCLSQKLFDPEINVEFVQFEIRMSGLRENREQAMEVGRRIGNALAKLVPAEKKDQPAKGKLIKLEFWETKDLKPHPLNQQIYGETEPDPELVASIRNRGILTPLTILDDGTLLSGHQRHAAAIKIGLDTVPATIFQSKDSLEIEEALIKANLQRQKTNEQKAREFSKIKEIETEKAKRRQIEAGRVHGKGQKVQENLPGAMKNGQARDIASAKLGSSGRTLEKSAKVVQFADKLNEVGETEKAQVLLDTLNGKSVDSAYRAAKKLESENSRVHAEGKSAPRKTDGELKSGGTVYKVDLIYHHKGEIQQEFEILDEENVTVGIKHRIEECLTYTLLAGSQDEAVGAALKMAGAVVKKDIKPTKIDAIENPDILRVLKGNGGETETDPDPREPSPPPAPSKPDSNGESLLPGQKSKKPKINRVQDWSSKTVNCCNGCSNGCLYCYARGEAVLRFNRLTDEQWKLGAVREKDVNRNYPKFDQTVMFPSTHDITWDNFEACHTVICKLVKAGNRVLVVTKPRPELVGILCDDFEPYKDQIAFRFTIGASNDDILSFWEPGAPNYVDRKKALMHTHARGYRTSVSLEPMLDSDNVSGLVEELRLFVNWRIWLGTMNHDWYLKKYQDPAIDAAFARIEDGQTVQRLQSIYDRYKDDPLIRFKGDFLKKLGLPHSGKSEGWPED